MQSASMSYLPPFEQTYCVDISPQGEITVDVKDLESGGSNAQESQQQHHRPRHEKSVLQEAINHVDEVKNFKNDLKDTKAERKADSFILSRLGKKLAFQNVRISSHYNKLHSQRYMKSIQVTLHENWTQ